MKLNLLLLALLTFSFASIAQNLTEENLMGEWQAVSVDIPYSDDMPPKEALKMVEDAFMGSKFYFKGNKVFRIEFGKLADKRMKELLFLDNRNWMLHEGKILIGSEDEGFNLMHIEYQENNGKSYFILPMIRLQMKKLSSDDPAKPKSVNSRPLNVEKVESVDYSEAEIVERDIDDSQIIPFEVVENPPLAPDCKSKWDLEKRKTCTQDFISNHIMRKFNTELAAEVGLTGKIRISIEFIIDTNGQAVNITASGGPDIMNQNAIEVIGLLPKVQPGTHKGQPVNVSYKTPLLFQIQD